jgi:hypothetical protein
MTPTKTKIIVTTSEPGRPPFRCVMTMSQISPNPIRAVRTRSEVPTSLNPLLARYRANK